MATVKDTRLLNVGMDKDSDERFVEQGRYRDAHNVRLVSMAGDETFDPEAGKIHSADGHVATSLSTVLDTGDKCHGAFKDPVSGIIYMTYAGSSAANNKIISFNETTSTPSLLIQSSFLAFNIRYPMLDMLMLDDILIFNDGLNPPRKINVTGSYSGLDTWEFDQVTNIIEKPPLYAPSISVGTDINFKGNNIIGKFFQFKYRFVYADNARSVFSPISAPAYSDFDIAAPDAVDTSTATHNLISVAMNVDHADVLDTSTNRYPQKIELAVRQGNNGDFFLVDTIDCSTLSEISYNFYNDGVYTPIALLESNQLFDDYPLVAGTMDIANGRIVFGDVTRGFDDSVTLDMEPNVILRDQPSLTPYTGTSPDRTVLQDFSTFETDLGLAPWIYTYSPGDKFTVKGASAATGNQKFGIVVIQSFIGESFESVYDRIMAASAGYPDIGIYDSEPSPKGTYENATFTITILNGADSQLGFKDGEWYKAGIVYEDEWGRQQGVYTDNKSRFYVPTIPEREGVTGAAVTNAGIPAFGMLINHDAPIWATRYKLAITPERVGARSVMLAVSAATQIGSTRKFKLELATLKDYAADYDNTNFVYEWAEGDRVRLIRMGVLGAWYTEVLDAEITKYEEVTSTTGDTTYDPVPTIEAFFPSTSVVLADLEGALIEIYSPSSSIDSDDGIWYEIPGCSYPIVALEHHGVINQVTGASGAETNKTPDALIEEGDWGRVRVAYDNTDFQPLPSVGVGNLVIKNLGTTDADWNGTYDVTGYDIQEAYIDILVTTASMPNGDATTPLTSCVDYTYDNSPAILTATAFNAYGRTRNMVDEYNAGYQVSDHYIVSRYMSDFGQNNEILFIGRPALVLNSRGEKRDRATVVYTEPYIFNTEINGIGRVFPDVNFEEYSQEFGTITKLFTRDDGILMLQEYKVSRILVNRDMIYNADGGGQMTTSANFLSKQVPFHGEYGCRRPESFASFGNFQFFFDTINGAPIVIAGTQLKDIGDTGMSKWFKGVAKTIEDYNAVSARRMLVFGEYDGLFDEYVLSIKDMTGVRDTQTLVFWMKSQTWLSFMDYDPEYLFRSHDRMIVVGDANIWRVLEGVPGYLMGSYKDSTIEVVSNVDPSETKNFFALDVDSIKAPTGVTIATKDNQASSLIAADFVKREGRYQSYILRNSNTPNIKDPLFNGDVLKAKSASFKFTFSNSPNDGVKLSTVSILVSRA
jgi:hypothetical protein